MSLPWRQATIAVSQVPFLMKEITAVSRLLPFLDLVLNLLLLISLYFIMHLDIEPR